MTLDKEQLTSLTASKFELNRLLMKPNKTVSGVVPTLSHNLTTSSQGLSIPALRPIMLRGMSDILNTIVRVILAIPEPSTIAAKMTACHIHSGEREIESNRVRSLGISMGSNGTWTCYPVGFCLGLIYPVISYALLFLSFLERTPVAI